MNKIEKSIIKLSLATTIALSGTSCAKAPEPVNVAEIPSPITSTALPPSPESDKFVVAPEAVAESVITSVCPTTDEAKQLFGVDVQKIETEPCGWVWRGSPESHSAVCPEEYVCTWDVKNDDVVVHNGIGQEAEIFAGTFRRVDTYPAEDKVHNICELYQAEKAFGQSEIPSFEVRFQPVPGVGPQSCPEK